MRENVPEVRMINMYMDHRDNLDDVLNSQTDSNTYCHYSSQVYHYADDVRSPGVILQELPEYDKAIVLHDKLDKTTSNEVHKTRKPTPSMNSATTKGEEKVVEGCVQHDTTKATSKGTENVAEVDGGFVDAEINEVRRSVSKRNPSIQQEADNANDSSKTDDESDPNFVDNEYDGEWGGANVDQSVPKPSIVGDFVDNEDMFAKTDDEQHLRGAPQSDKESTGHRFPEFNPSYDMGTVEFESEKYRIRAICAAENYPFEIYVSKMQHEDTLQVKRLDPKHTCSRATIQRNINSGISLSKARRAKNKALKILEGTITAQYARLWDYAAELRNTNPGTTVQIKCDFNVLLQRPMFHRMYICLGAYKEGFKAGCKPLIGLGGCHLKSPYGGQLLSAVGLDASNMAWVIAYAQVEMETNDLWIWVLQLLVKDIELANQYGFAFISDKQKGLVEAFEEVVPNCDHRFCARHLSTNFSLVFKGKILKDAMWRAAFATTVPEFRRAMEVLRTLDGEAYT
ncbi:PREDICTED: LOC18777017 isoform [Prunus dulcis]|uniref:PREDICTED: LOC18777017 isoform n=1 Tax=Prunus dulcis TaxID=3755 RepID=A0A5E4FL06_PRUDU|nr:PREDICTED: LOC18777017 isoform [Prunus dulcis]